MKTKVRRLPVRRWIKESIAINSNIITNRRFQSSFPLSHLRSFFSLSLLLFLHTHSLNKAFTNVPSRCWKRILEGKKKRKVPALLRRSFSKGANNSLDLGINPISCHHILPVGFDSDKCGLDIDRSITSYVQENNVGVEYCEVRRKSFQSVTAFVTNDQWSLRKSCWWVSWKRIILKNVMRKERAFRRQVHNCCRAIYSFVVIVLVSIAMLDHVLPILLCHPVSLPSSCPMPRPHLY